MEEAIDGPAIGATARTLGARPDVDIPLTPEGLVRPGLGGMSVSPDSPMNLPRHRRPPEWNGTGKDLIWSITTDLLGNDLSYRPDPEDPTHGFVEPARPMLFNEYQGYLFESARSWRLHRRDTG